MKIITLPLLAAVATAALTIGSAAAMPFSTSNGAAVLNESLVQDVRVVCNRHGNCWNTNRYRSSRRSYSSGYRAYSADYSIGPATTANPAMAITADRVWVSASAPSASACISRQATCMIEPGLAGQKPGEFE